MLGMLAQPPVLSKVFKVFDFPKFDMSEKKNVNMFWDLFLGFLKWPGVSRENNIGFGSHGHIPKFGNRENKGLRGSPRMKSK